MRSRARSSAVGLTKPLTMLSYRILLGRENRLWRYVFNTGRRLSVTSRMALLPRNFLATEGRGGGMHTCRLFTATTLRYDVYGLCIIIQSKGREGEGKHSTHSRCHTIKVTSTSLCTNMGSSMSARFIVSGWVLMLNQHHMADHGGMERKLPGKRGRTLSFALMEPASMGKRFSKEFCMSSNWE